MHDIQIIIMVGGVGSRFDQCHPPITRKSPLARMAVPI